jgi:hypothetical protein
LEKRFETSGKNGKRDIRRRALGGRQRGNEKWGFSNGNLAMQLQNVEC